MTGLRVYSVVAVFVTVPVLTMIGNPTASASVHAPVAYVLNSAKGTVTPINTTTNLAGKPIKVGRKQAQYIGYSLDASTVYVGRDDGSSTDTVTPIHVVTNTAGKPVKLSAVKIAAWGCATTVATTPNGKT
ncbi:MAG: hypothetical protein ACLPSM_06195, partial [Acidimicrobiales bacterium]